ncbi:nitric oxide-associated protein 1 [Lates japonicus]|uniref:Nitric oxide-associated protein 1 n=1 Tax=Lates japonicus TaxID=270547 RepID=A0AAD3RJK0_LATJO|nr:nitric oxide-associated protein 1 [Lates japonicus]
MFMPYEDSACESEVTSDLQAPVHCEFTHNELKDATAVMTPRLRSRDVRQFDPIPPHRLIDRLLFDHASINLAPARGNRWFSVVGLRLRPVHITSLEKADIFMRNTLDTALLGVSHTVTAVT